MHKMYQILCNVCTFLVFFFYALSQKLFLTNNDRTIDFFDGICYNIMMRYY